MTNLFATARLPLGISIYDQTTMDGAQYIGVRDSWKVMFDACKAKDIAWNWKTMSNSTVDVSGDSPTNYVLDCSKYMAWLWYNVTHTDASEPIRIPANCSGKIFKDHIEITPFEEEPVEVVQQDQFNMMKAYELAYNALKQGEKNFWQTHESIMPLFNGMDCFDPIYEILECMDKQGILNIRLVEVVGARKDLTAPQYMFSIK
jgi:hypothetical protein